MNKKNDEYHLTFFATRLAKSYVAKSHVAKSHASLSPTLGGLVGTI